MLWLRLRLWLWLKETRNVGHCITEAERQYLALVHWFFLDCVQTAMVAQFLRAPSCYNQY